MVDPILILTGLIAVGAAVGVVASREAVGSALFLTLHLVGMAGLFLALTFQFLAVAQVLVYAGAVMVVFLFAVNTLTPIPEPFRWTDSGGLPIIGLLSGLALCIGTVFAIWSSGALSGLSVADSHELETVQTFALNLFGPFLFPFEATAFVLLVALIGAVILGGRVRKNG